MVTALTGTWWRESRRVESSENLWAVAAGPVNWVFAGAQSGAPRLYTVATADMFALAPSYIARTPAGTDAFFGAGYVPTADVFCAVGNNGRYEVSTDDGVTWSGGNLGGGPELRAVAAADDKPTGQFMAAGDGEIWGRDTAGAWTSRWSGSPFWRSIAYLAGVGWVAVGDTGFATDSATGLAASFAAPYQIQSDTLWEVAAGHNRFMAVGNGGRVWTSTTGGVGSWTAYGIPIAASLRTVVALGAADSWAAATLQGQTIYSADNGATWTENALSVDRLCVGMAAVASGAAVVGSKSGVHVSVDNTQTDPPAPVDPPTSEAAYAPNDDMAGDAVRRLVTQLRSGRVD